MTTRKTNTRSGDSSPAVLMMLLRTVAMASLLLSSLSLDAAEAADDDNFAGCVDRRLAYPEVIDMDEMAKRIDPVLEIDLKWIFINPGFGDNHGYKNDPDEMICGSSVFQTRALGGSVPGPTLAASPGTTMKIRFRNRLTYQRNSYSSRVVVDALDASNIDRSTLQQVGEMDLQVPPLPPAKTSIRMEGVTNTIDLYRLNRYNDPDVANLHFHGLHVPGVLPSDDSTLEVLPQEEYEYTIEIPEDHHPGLHWIHPHHHGSSTLQRVGGAAMAIIIKDDLPPRRVATADATEPVVEPDTWHVRRARKHRTLQQQEVEGGEEDGGGGDRASVEAINESVIAALNNTDTEGEEAGDVLAAEMNGGGGEEAPDAASNPTGAANSGTEVPATASPGTDAGATTDTDTATTTATGTNPPSIPSNTLVLPPEVRGATERILIFQEWDVTEALLVAKMAGDQLLVDSFEQITGGESIGQRFVTVNGKYQPVTSIEAGVWERWRFLYAGWQDLPMEFGLTAEGNGADCEFYLLAKDGIYIADYPRGPMITEDGKKLPIPPGGRADFMVRCNAVGGTSRFEALSRRNTLIVNVVEESGGGGDDEADADAEVGEIEPLGEGATETEKTETENDLSTSTVTNSDGEVTTSASSSTSSTTTTSATPAAGRRSVTTPTPWTISESQRPDYLRDAYRLEVSEGCSCVTKFEGYDDSSRVNGNIHRPGNTFMHTTYVGAVVERELKGMNEHSYHQHVYPYQIVDFPYREPDQTVYDGAERSNSSVSGSGSSSSSSSAYFKVGDWHDVYLDKDQSGGATVTIRYTVTDYPGKMMVHCHNTLHSDRGVMAKEYVRTGNDGSDYCECDIFGPIDGPGIVDDVNEQHVIGGTNAEATDARGSGGATAAVAMAVVSLGSWSIAASALLLLA